MSQSEPLHIRQPRNIIHKHRFALFNFGFRPFFLFGAIYGIFVISYFILMMSGAVSYLPSHLDMLSWHRHEMLFGFTGAIIAGFLFTAVAHWSGQETPRQLKLAAVVLLWIMGRLAIFFSSWFPPLVSILIDTSFFVVCAICLAAPLLKAHNQRNYFFIVLLALLALASFLDHEGGSVGIKMALGIITMMMVVVGSRVIPLFTQNATGKKIKKGAIAEKGAILLTLVAVMLNIFYPAFILLPFLYLLAAIMIMWQLWCWRGKEVLLEPLLWILHLGYAWIAISFVLSAMSKWNIFDSFSLSVHALTVGAIGCLTLGIMTRASLGHTGRLLVISTFMRASLFAMMFAGVARVVLPIILPEHLFLWLEIAAGLWAIAFGIFIFYFTPILFRPSLGMSNE